MRPIISHYPANIITVSPGGGEKAYSQSDIRVIDFLPQTCAHSTDMLTGNAVGNAYPSRVKSKKRQRKPPGLAVVSASGPHDPLPAFASPGKEWAREEWIVALCEPPRRTVLLIDDLGFRSDNLRELLERDGYRVLTARLGLDALEMLSRMQADLIILEMLLPDMDGPEFCRRLRADRRLDLVPALMLSSVQTIEDEVTGIGSGADAFLVWPLHPEIFAARVRSMLRRKPMVDRLEESETILLALAQAVELRDPNTAGRCERLAALSVAMA
jgi:CheY-like chemotaxis protein